MDKKIKIIYDINGGRSIKNDFVGETFQYTMRVSNGVKKKTHPVYAIGTFTKSIMCYNIVNVCTYGLA